MATRALLHRLPIVRSSPRLDLNASRAYIAARSFTPRSATKAPPSPSPVGASGTGIGNPEIQETLPTTADEVDAPVVPTELSSTSSSNQPPPPYSSNGNGNGNGGARPFGADNGNNGEASGLGFGGSEGLSTDWSRSYHGLSIQPFASEVSEVLMAPLDPLDVEMKPDGLIYLPEIKYRRILNKAFGPGGWGLAPRSETNVGPKVVSREYALVCLGRLVAIARGEQEYFDPSGIPTATEACKSNALMRCCKDLGIASELWDPRFIREFKSKYCIEVFAEHLPTKKKKKLWRRKDQPKFEYPYKE